MKTKPKRKAAAGKTTPAALSEKRRAAARSALASRWGETRSPSRQIRVDEAAFNALQIVPERDRRTFASRAILAAVDKFANP